MSSKKNITIDQTALLNTSDNKHSIKRQKKNKTAKFKLNHCETKFIAKNKRLQTT